MIADQCDNGPGMPVSYLPRWEAWFAQQRVLSDQYVKLQVREGKEFVLEDIDVTLTVDTPFTLERRQPTACEFMAYITVTVVTNIEMAADARVSGRKSMKKDFKADPTIEVLHPDEEGCIPSGVGGSCYEDLGDKSNPEGGPMRPHCAMKEKDVTSIAYFEGFPPRQGRSKTYKEDFEAGMGAWLKPRADATIGPLNPFSGGNDIASSQKP